MNTYNSTKVNKQKVKAVQITVAALLFIWGVLSALYGKAQQSNDKPGIFYAVTGNGLKDTSWLFGTYHLVNSSYLKEMPGAQLSFKKSKGLAVEIVMDSAKMAAAQAMGMMKDKTLTTLLDKPFSDSLENELKSSIGVGISQLNQLKPMTVTITLSLVYLMKNNGAMLQKYSGLPLDAHFVQEGKRTAKSITALETIEEQMNLLFNKTSDEEQVNQLKSFLRNKNEMIQLGDDLLQSWFNQDLNNMYSIYVKTLQLSGEEDYLIKGRNDNWMKVLPELMAKEPQFIAVGALHLAGPEGLVQQLQRIGYTVTTIK